MTASTPRQRVMASILARISRRVVGERAAERRVGIIHLAEKRGR